MGEIYHPEYPRVLKRVPLRISARKDFPPNSSSCCIELDQWAENMCTSAIIHITHTSQYTYICVSLHWKAVKTTMLRRTRVCDPESVQSMYCNHRVLPSQLGEGGSINGPWSCLSISTSIPVEQPQWSHWSGILLVLNHSVIFFSKSKTRFL